MHIKYFLPAHPSYFDDKYTQEEIDKSIEYIDLRYGGDILKGRMGKTGSGAEFKEEFILLRQPGKNICTAVEPTPYRPGTTEQDMRIGVEQARRYANSDLNAILATMKTRLETNRGGSSAGLGPSRQTA